MEISIQQLEDALAVKVRGRLDNYWTEHLRTNLEEFVRGGAHVIRLDLSEVSFLSSAGVGLLMLIYRQLKEIGGTLVIASPSVRVKQVLDLCKLSPHPADQPGTGESRRAQVRNTPLYVSVCSIRDAGMSHAKAVDLRAYRRSRITEVVRLRSERLPIAEVSRINFRARSGGFRARLRGCAVRFGEFLAVGGSAAYLPTDGTNVPDFMVCSGDLVPEVNVLYGLRCEGGFTHLLRFEAAHADSPVVFSELVATALEVSGAPAIGMVMVVESAGLVGAALRRSPGTAPVANTSPFQYPEVRTWLSFSTERLYSRSLVLISGIAASSPSEPLAPLLRRMGGEALPVGHFHAAAFSYRPLKKGDIDLSYGLDLVRDGNPAGCAPPPGRYP